MPSLFTIGYEGLEFREFVEILKKAKVEILIDIRAIPNSRKKGFSKKALAGELSRHGVDYLHLQGLGSPKELRDKVRANGDYASFFIAYNKFLDSQSDSLGKLLDFATTRHACLLCFERDINCCHRKAVAEQLQKISKNKLRPIHLNQPE